MAITFLGNLQIIGLSCPCVIIIMVIRKFSKPYFGFKLSILPWILTHISLFDPLKKPFMYPLLSLGIKRKLRLRKIGQFAFNHTETCLCPFTLLASAILHCYYDQTICSFSIGCDNCSVKYTVLIHAHHRFFPERNLMYTLTGRTGS